MRPCRLTEKVDVGLGDGGECVRATVGLCSVPSLGTVKAAKLGDTLLLALALDSKDLQACHLQKHACFIVYIYI